jgi:hypothetical protein
MFDFMVPPLVMWICVSGVYSLCELYACRKERIMMLERFGEKTPPAALRGKFELPVFTRKSFSGLKAACLLIGLGLGLIVGLMISTQLVSDGYALSGRNYRDLHTVAYAAPVLIFGGIGLLTSFLIENKASRQKPES